MKRIWHKLFHRNPRKYPLPMGWGCKSCDDVRWKWMSDDPTTDWIMVRDEIQGLPWIKDR